MRAGRGLQCQCRADRGQGLGDPADPGTGRAGLARRHPLPAAIRQDHALSALPKATPVASGEALLRREMHAQTAMIENGFVHLPKDAGWRAEYLHELTIFPKRKYD